MFNRAAEYFAHGPRGLSPAYHRLHPEQRVRLDKSSLKVGKVLGETPIIDIMPASPVEDAPSITLPEKKRGRKRKAAPAAPILRYKLGSVDRPATPTPKGRLGVPAAVGRPRKAVPHSLNLGVPVWRSEMSTSSPSGRNRPGFLSPLSPLSPFSPIETSDMREERYHGLRRLARASRAFRDTIIEELPSLGQTTENAENLQSYLDLYRVATSVKKEFPHSARTPCSSIPSAYTTFSSKSRRRSSSLSQVQRRSFTSTRSITPTPRGTFILPHSASVYSFVEQSSTGSITPTPRGSFIVPHSASVYSFVEQPSRHRLLINVPSPRTPIATIELRSATNMRFSRMSYTIVLNLPPKSSSDLPNTPSHEDSPLQIQQKEAHKRAAILTAMQRPVSVASTLAQPMLSPAPPMPTPFNLKRARSPRVPYWVHSAYRVSAHGYVRRTHTYSRKTASRVPPTPRTIRKEKRQGWGGEWKRGVMAVAVEELKQIKTPAPVVLESEVVPAEMEMDEELGVVGEAQ